ncbi:MAG: LysR family transcriptional regulator [Archangium sp.]
MKKHHPENGTADFSDLPLFLAVARSQSFAAAARQTGVPLSTVSRSVARLEERLGVRLLTRTTRRVTLTHEGALLLERTGGLADELGERLRDASSGVDEPAGVLRVTAPVVTGAGPVARVLRKMLATFPRLTVELHLGNELVDLVKERYDLAIRNSAEETPGLIARKLWNFSFALAASPDFVRRELRGRHVLDEETLRSVPSVATRPAPVWRFRRKNGEFAEVRPRPRLVVSDPRVAAETAADGLGVVFAPRMAIEACAKKLVTLSTTLGEPESRVIYAVYPSRQFLPARTRVALEWLQREGSG